MPARVLAIIWGALVAWALAGCSGGSPGGGLDDGGVMIDGRPADAEAVDEREPRPVDAARPAPTDATRPDEGPADAGQPDAEPPDAGEEADPGSSAQFLAYAQPDVIPGRLPDSPCAALTEHHTCVATAGCGWLRTIKDNGLCRADPVSRCLSEGECACAAHAFHGDAAHEDDLELFLPLSIIGRNLAPRTSAFGSGDDRYTVLLDMDPVINESYENFTSRTDFTAKRLSVEAQDRLDAAGLVESGGLSLTLKFMPVWDRDPAGMSGVLLDGLGMRVVLDAGRVAIETVDGVVHPVAGEHPITGEAKDYQCNQLAVIVPPAGDATAWLGPVQTRIPGLDMATVRAAVAAADGAIQVLSIGPASAKVWDLRLYAQGRQLDAGELAEIGKRCGAAGDYPIPEGYPESNTRYAYGMGGTRVAPHHAEGHFSSGVYVTLRIPEGEVFPPLTEAGRDNLNRMIGFWDRWHEQMYFEADMVPFVDTRPLPPDGALNSYRDYPEPLCVGDDCGEQVNFADPCRYATDLFQAMNWLPEDWPDEPTSADHRRITERGGYTRWPAPDRALYQSWTRPVHEHGHTAHFTLMRTYAKVHHYVRGIAGESFAEVMVQYVLTGTAPWMLQGLSYYPSIPLALEGRWDGLEERHVFKSPQPYQSGNIDDRGLGSRFYGAGLWWTFVAHFAGKPYMVGRISGDTDLTPGTTLQRLRFYLAQEGLDLGDLFGNFAAHLVTWDWPHIGHFLYEVEQEPFQGIATWCTRNSGPDCTIDGLKIHADVSPEAGTDGAWVDGPSDRQPGGFASNTIRIAQAPGGALYAISLEFEVPEVLFPDAPYHIGLRESCREDPRFFSSRIVVAEAGSEGQAERPRPAYYKIPGRRVNEVIIQVPEGPDANVYVLPTPTPPFELEDVPGFSQSPSLVWPYRYRITRLDAVPEGATLAAPTTLDGDQTLSLEPQAGNGFTFDCFAGQPVVER